MAKTLSNDDKETWKLFVRDIQPLAKEKKFALRDESYNVSKPKIKTNEYPMFVTKYVMPPTRGKEVFIEGQIDLHGMTEETAYAALILFISRMQAKKHKWGLVVTGKSGILFEMVPKWLGAMPDKIRFFTRARPLHGGSGALYLQFAYKKETR